MEYWLIHPLDRMVMIHRLRDGEYGAPELLELASETAVGVLPGVTVNWDALAQRLAIADD